MQCVLYSTSDCHLCEEALALMQPLIRDGRLAVGVVDIAADPRLVAVYGERIPVLRCEATGRELNWPFDAVALEGFLTA